jgi:hypothetical protein
MTTTVANSVSPSGEVFPLPTEADYAGEFERVRELSELARAAGKEVVVVMGVGFVGAVMAAIIADTVDRQTGKPGKFVIGCQRPSPRSYWKIPVLNRGEAPVTAEDPEVTPMIERCVNEKKTLVGTYNSDVLSLADCVVVDVQCDYLKHEHWYEIESQDTYPAPGHSWSRFFRNQEELAHHRVSADLNGVSVFRCFGKRRERIGGCSHSFRDAST